MAAHLETADIQGIILSGYGHLPHSTYLFLHFDDRAAARAWLRELIPRVTTSDWSREPNGKPERALNVAFTCPGLEALGLDAETVRTFSQEFREGMADPSRARRLGDIRGSAPDLWEIGGSKTAPEEQIHALLILQDRTPEALETHRTEERGRLPAGLREAVPAETGCQEKSTREHFGFRDGISQPAVEGSPNTRSTQHGCIPAGEFILGYRNAYEVFPPTPYLPASADPAGCLAPYPPEPPEAADRRDLGKNGSYLVFRKLHQDAAAWRRYLQEQSGGNEAEAARLGAKMVGRWPSGAPLVLAPEEDRPELGEGPRSNDFTYAGPDPDGTLCPIGAHIRRTQPRDALVGSVEESLRTVSRHRILRRGAPYGEPLPAGSLEDDGQPRGILFVCINADIRRQFEFIQQTWANNPRFGGLYNDSDPLIGINQERGQPDDEGPWRMTIPQTPVRRRLEGLPRFVQVKGGGYYFMPGIAALRFLAERGEMGE